MNIYSTSLLCFSFGVLLIAVLALIKRKDIVSMRFVLFSVSACGWGFPSSAWFSQIYSLETGLALMRIAHAFGVFIPISWLHFVFTFTGKKEPIKYFYFINYVISSLLLLLSPTPLFIKGLHPIMGFKYYTSYGPFYHIYSTLFFIYVPYAFYYLVSAYRASTGYARGQLKFLIIGTVIGFFSGGTAFLPVYDIPFIFLGFSLMPLYPIFMGIALMRYGLFDVQQIADAFQREKLATIGLIAASINHEIRNPLYAARGVLETYLENLKEGILRKEPKEVTERAMKQIDRALEVITKLNRFAKPVSDSIAQDSKASVQEAIQNVLDLVSYEFELDKIHIRNQIEPNIPPIQADQRQLEEILFNLIVNACHAMSASNKEHDRSAAPYGGAKGGTLVISASCHSRASGNLDPRSKHSEAVLLRKHSGMTDKVQITIKDTGTGIPSEQTKHLFEPFHTTKGEKGTGLGLYITKQLVERNHGKITVKSQEGKGTAFVLEFKVGG